MRIRIIDRWPVIMALVCLAGCGSVRSAAPSFVRADSAGVTIVTSTGPADAGRGTYRVDSIPLLDLGADPNDPAQEFSGLVIPRFLSTGQIAVLNGGTSEIRIFDTNGTALAVFGRRGKGPGEFEFPAWFGTMQGDSMLVLDLSNGRITVFDPAGRSARLATVRALGRITSTASFEDGSILGFSGVPLSPSPEPYRPTITFWIVSPDGARADSLRALAGPEIEFRRSQVGTRVTTGLRPVDYGRTTIAVAAGDRVILGDQARFELQVLDRAGIQIGIYRVDVPARLVTEADREALVEEAVALIPPDKREPAKELRRAHPSADTLPAFDHIVVSTSGEIWIREYPVPPGSRAPVAWRVLAPSGEWRTTVMLSGAFLPWEITSDRLLGVWKDENDVSHVRVHRLAER